MAIDGNSIINRAFYGIKPLTNKSGLHTHAVYGFFTILGRYIKQDKPDAVCVTFDLKAPTFRHEMYDGYKASRKGMPDELAEQLPYLKRALDAMGIPRFELAGWEADDLLGAISSKCADDGAECVVVTGDRDSLQLVRPGISVRLVQGRGESVLYDTDAFTSEYGFEPKRLIDLKALMGDKSDDIPGVKGVGEKTASELITAYGSLESVYANLDAVKTSVRAKLEADREMAELSYKLAAIASDAPLEFTVPTEGFKINNDELYTLFKELEFNSLIKTYNLNEPENFEEPAAFDGPPADEIACYLLDPVEKRAYSADEAERLLKEQEMWYLYTEIEKPLEPILKAMTATGFKVNVDALRGFGATLDSSINHIAFAILEITGPDFNINSPRQLGELLFTKMGLEPPAYTKKVKSGGYSTDAETLEKLSVKYPDFSLIGMILEYRKAAKLKSTYVEGLLPLIDENGRIHTTFNQTQTATGRLSSLEPNLQNIPVRGELGAELRKFFVAEDGWKLVDADYSQIELRILAHLSGDSAMIDAFKNSEDIHAATAAQVFGVPLAEVTKQQRTAAKAVNFGIVYGISDFSLAQDIKVSRAEAKEYIDAYLTHFGGVREYMERVIDSAKEDGYVSTIFGRRRYLPELKSSNYNTRSFGERVARNMPIQGAAADIIKLARVKVNERIKREGLKTRLILQVHDELIAEAPADEAEIAAKILSEEMQNAAELKVPLTVDAHIAENWYDAK
jgi:DNA polymerase I-like protein with 3'-5' exonuclease and polymerase domains